MSGEPLRIAIDASRTTVARVTGTERYALELIRAMIEHNRRHQLTLYFRDQPPPDLLPKTEHVTIRTIPFHRAWTHLRFAAAIWRTRPDVTFVPAHTLPFVFPGKAIVTVHDLGYKHFPEAHPWQQRAYLNLTTRYSARRATHIFADSQATATDLEQFYGINPQKIDVIYPGVMPPTITETDIYQKYNLPKRYFLFIGTLQPRKNIARLVEAYKAYRERSNRPVDLVLAGRKGWLFDDSWTSGIDGLHLIGYIDEADKGALYQNAVALAFPSLFEGFGFPVIEAMHMDLPVITSSTSSLPELAGDAAIVVDPQNTLDITRAMIRISTDYTFRETLRAAGFSQADKFTWDAAAQQALNRIESIGYKR